ncbi:type I restriction-modification system subunit M [Aliterella atlantica]|uniref:site-specific DNA-methyltransferase (adenine-specific) n=1 Tax=Aliterella atlantica CENA595 TaxID=1618023 RepID=A0A0D8ZUR3_9CYAN|nr:class I SAM-dependent DNA methyltransferase [Aliterella atlantica]KJH72518.1 DNA methyltransferase [Aliterella atlantica CENA595]
MITGEMRSKVDRLWTTFWNNGISNPLSVIEQISYLLFIKRLDDLELVKERRAQRLGEAVKEPIFSVDKQMCRWSYFKNLSNAEEMLKIVRDEAFPFIKNLGLGAAESTYVRHMKDAVFLIASPALLASVVGQIEQIPMEDRDTKGDLYEYMLSKLTTAGTNGQFRTPRHIIKMMVELMAPHPREIICDPACGTAGFLVAAAEYLRDLQDSEGNYVLNAPGNREHFNRQMFHGFDFDATMLRIGSMNLMLHGIEDPQIEARDSLCEDCAGVTESFTLILANPPFKGSLEKSTIAKDLTKIVTTTKTELLFIALILRLLKIGGRAAAIVPDGVLFGSSTAHKKVREMLVEQHKLDGVISMPSGVFKPYAGVSTAVLMFTKTGAGGTDDVWFYDMAADGLSLDDKRQPVAENDIPDLLKQWRERGVAGATGGVRTGKAFFVPKAEIAANGYDLSINRYKETEYAEVSYESPKVILQKLRSLEDEIRADLDALEELLG